MTAATETVKTATCRQRVYRGVSVFDEPVVCGNAVEYRCGQCGSHCADCHIDHELNH